MNIRTRYLEESSALLENRHLHRHGGTVLERISSAPDVLNLGRGSGEVGSGSIKRMEITAREKKAF